MPKAGREANYGHKSKKGYCIKEIFADLYPVSFRYYEFNCSLNHIILIVLAWVRKQKSHIGIYSTSILPYHVHKWSVFDAFDIQLCQLSIMGTSDLARHQMSITIYKINFEDFVISNKII